MAIDQNGFPRWYVAQTLARREQFAMQHLSDQGFKCFLPVIEKTVRHARKLTIVRRAFFPGYIFISLDLTRDRWRSVNGTRGVSRMIMGQEAPMPVPAGVIETLQGRLDASGLCRFDGDLKIGARVEVMTGPLAQHFGEIISLDDAGRARVLLDIMNGKIAVRLAGAALNIA